MNETSTANLAGILGAFPNLRFGAWVLSAIVVCGCADRFSPSSTKPTPQEPIMSEVRIPTPEQEQEIALEGGHVDPWQLTLGAGEIVTVRVEQRGIDVILRLRAPDGTLLAEMDGPYGSAGFEELSWVAEEAGDFRLEVASDSPGVEAGRYAFWSSSPHPATADDRRHVQALLDLCRGDGLRRQGTAEDLAQARELFDRALATWRSLGDTRWQLQVLQRIGLVSDLTEAPAAAISAYTEAAALARSTGIPDEEIRNENRLAGLLITSHDTDGAWPHLERALDLATELDDPVLLGHTRSNLAAFKAERHETDEALSLYLELSDHWQALGRPLEQADALHNRAMMLYRQGKLANAAEDLERCIEARAAGQDEPGRIADLISLGDTRLQLRQLPEAIAALEAARDAGPAGRLNPRWSAFLSNSLGLAYGQQEGSARGGSSPSLDHALDRALDRALEHFQSALDQAHGAGNWRFAAIVDFNVGALLEKAGRSEEALEHLDSALEAFERWGDDSRRAMALLGTGLALRDLGRLPEALEQIEAAVSTVEGLRLQHVSWDFRMWFLASKQRYFEELVDLLVELHQSGARPASGPSYLEQALQVVERRRARTFLDALAEAKLRTDVPADLLEDERKTGAELHEVEAALRGATPEESHRLASRRDELLLRLEATRGKIREVHPQFADLTRPAPLAVDAIRDRLLDEGSQLLIYSLGERRSFLFVVERGQELEVFELADRERLAATVEEALALVRTRSRQAADRRHGSLERLADQLLTPLYEHRAKGRWVIVPDGFLELVPFAALRVPSSLAAAPSSNAPQEPSDGRSYLVERREIVSLPSASSLDAIRRESPGRPRPSLGVAIFADPVFSADDERLPGDHPETGPKLPDSLRQAARAAGLGEVLERLPFTRLEATSIAAQLNPMTTRLELGFEARKGPEFRGLMRGAGILHFATHGLVDHQRPELSALVLSLFDENGKPQDGYLYAHELFSTRIAAQLVVLSACETGIGPEVPGEGIQGLSRAFLYAGAPRVITSLWSVDDESTASLMSELYRQMLELGHTPAAALRAAQLRLLHDTDQGWFEPVHWAPFILVGDWQEDPESEGDGRPPIDKDQGGGVLLEPGGSTPGYPIPPDDPKEESKGRGSDGGTAERMDRRSGFRQSSTPIDFDPDAYVNGIDAETGLRLPPGPDGRTLLAHPEALLPGDRLERSLRWWTQYHSIDDPERRPIFDVDPERLDQAGWAVVFGPSATKEVRDALDPLLKLRESQAGTNRFRRIDIPAGWTSDHFRIEHELGFGPSDPDVMPYYLLLVGNPEEVPFELQYGLDVQYAVGRLDLETADDYARYAETVERIETEPQPQRPVSIFGVDGPEENERFLIEALVDPIAARLQAWQSQATGRPPVLRELDDRKADFARLLADPPGFLFAAGHGLRCDPTSLSLATSQGALVCSDHLQTGLVTPDSYFGGDDLPENADLDGLITFVFACYSAGCPERDDFFEELIGKPKRIAPNPLVSHLSRRMLAQGAQAFVGHVDRAWGTSFDFAPRKRDDSPQRGGNSIKAYDSAFRQLLSGCRLGHAMEYINQRYAEGSTALTDLLHRRTLNPATGSYLSLLRKATLDARNYVILGDPAVRVVGVGRPSGDAVSLA